MGMYTEIYVNVNLKQDTPGEVISALIAMCTKDSKNTTLPYPRWAYLFNDGSFYTPKTECGKLTYNDISKQWSLLGKGDIKNYDGEIEAFFKWLMPYIDARIGEFIGYSRYEEEFSPTLYYKE